MWNLGSALGTDGKTELSWHLKLRFYLFLSSCILEVPQYPYHKFTMLV